MKSPPPCQNPDSAPGKGDMREIGPNRTKMRCSPRHQQPTNHLGGGFLTHPRCVGMFGNPNPLQTVRASPT